MDFKNISSKYNCLWLIVFITFSCAQNTQEEVSTLRSEVLMLHDEVMPLIGDLKSLRKEVDKEANRLVKEDSITNAVRIYNLRGLADEMDLAFEGMFVWMRQYKANQDSMSREEVLLYLKEQKSMVQKVNQEINATLSTAKAELGKGS